MTDEFLALSASVGNDLSTPRPELGFGGLVAGDRWCVCADRWQEAFEAGVAPPVVLGATTNRSSNPKRRMLRYDELGLPSRNSPVSVTSVVQPAASARSVRAAKS